MGCSTSKNAVAAFERSSSIKAKSATNSINDKNTEEGIDPTTENSTSYLKYRPSETFVVPLEDKVDNNQGQHIESMDELTKVKPLPKRLQRLMEQSQIKADNPSKAIENLEEKLAKAEERRQEYLQQKVNSIQKTTQFLQEDQVETNDGKVFKIEDHVLDQMNAQTNENVENRIASTEKGHI